MNHTAQAERPHIALFGRCNSGKSSLLNRLVGEQAAIVSAEAGTTTDPVRRATEWPGLGAVLLIDTPGLDDSTSLAEERIARSRRLLDETDLALLLFGDTEWSVEEELLREIRRRGIPVLALLAQCDRIERFEELAEQIEQRFGLQVLPVSAQTGAGVQPLQQRVASLIESEERLLTEGLCEAGDCVLLVMPQDDSAPKGRLIKPQVQTLRELLDRGCVALCCTPEGMPKALQQLVAAPKLVITDSQAFAQVEALTPKESHLTSFSVLMARYKGDIREFVAGATLLRQLRADARILIAEACSHTPQQEDIGRVKLPKMLRRRFGEGLQIEVVGGRDFPEDLTPYDLIIHCGACMFNRRLVLSRVARAREQGVPITNYGVAIAALQGILERVVW